MKNAIINIKTVQASIPDFEEEVIELTTEGKYAFKNGSLYLIYDESEISGMEGTTTSLKLNDKSFTLRRMGNSVVSLEFSPGKRVRTVYKTPFGDVPVEILTKEIHKDLVIDPMELNLRVEYGISIKNMFEGSNHIIIHAKTS